MFKIEEMHCEEYRHVQPADVFSLILSPEGIRDVNYLYKNVCPSCMYDENGMMKYPWTDKEGRIGKKGTDYTSNELYKKWLNFLKDKEVITMTKAEVDLLIADARTRGVYFYGDDKPYLWEKI